MAPCRPVAIILSHIGLIVNPKTDALSVSYPAMEAMRQTTAGTRTDTIRLQLDFFQGPVWPSDFETGEPLTGNPVVDADEQVRTLNKRIGNLYSSYYIFAPGQPCRFDESRERRDRSLMLRLLNKPNERLRAINDGSFIVDDRETGRVTAL